MKIVLTTWCPQNIENSNGPGHVHRVTKFQPVTAQHDKANPNGTLFADGNVLGYTELTNLTPEVANQIKTGKKYRITIESIEE